MNNGLLHVQRGVARFIVGRCPGPVASDCVQLINRHPRSSQGLVVEHAPNLIQPSVDELAIVLTVERAQQGQALDADDMGQGMLIRHSRRS